MGRYRKSQRKSRLIHSHHTFSAQLFSDQGAEELTLLTTVTRVVNLPMIVGLRLLEREDGVKVTIRDLRSLEAVMLAVIDGQGQVATGFAPFYPAVEKGAPVKAVMELSRPDFVVMAKKEITSVKALNSPPARVNVLSASLAPSERANACAQGSPAACSLSAE